ncbi:hypothetical protein [Propionivibrio sp.]|uniref:hypothetical protein n=1 Tax=Propionivibrio sp. TaxID=2212460 RepID=UPI003BF23E0B
MTKRIHQDYFKRETAEVSKFVESLKDNAVKAGTFDSASASDFILRKPANVSLCRL